MKLRRAVPGDVPVLCDIRCSVTQNHQSREELALLGINPDTVREMIESGDFVNFVAEEDGSAVGFAMAQISEAYVFACFVRPAFEDRGIGRALMTAVEDGLRSAGVREAWLSTGSEPGLRAAGFYEHLGWRADGYLEDGQIRFVKNLRST